MTLAALAIFAASVAVSGCSRDDFDEDEPSVVEGIPTEVSVSLGVLRSDGTPTADGTPENPASDAEKINSWWIAFVDHNGIVRHIETRKATDPVEMENFKCIVPSGVYTLYSFANISQSELKSATGLGFSVGHEISFPAGVAKAEDAVWSLSLNGLQGQIPMSGILYDVRVRNTIEETFSIEVVRMAAKVELLFSNAADEAITLNSLTFDPVTLSAISLFPKGVDGPGYSHLGHTAYKPLPDALYGVFSFPLTSGNVIKPGEEKKSQSIYIQESLSGRDNGGAFTVGVNVSHAGGVSDYQQYNITRDILSYINRNDHIVIPITLTRYDVEVEAVGYPPIGGYPATVASIGPDGSQIFTFASYGDFAIAAKVTDKKTGRHLAPMYYSLELSDVPLSNPIFAIPPTVIAGTTGVPDEVTGSFSLTPGRAAVNLTVTVYDRPRSQADAKALASYTRRLFIIRT